MPRARKSCSEFGVYLAGAIKAAGMSQYEFYTQAEVAKPYPDFLIVRSDPNANAGYVVDVLEPHSPDFDDNLAKAKALAKYAEDEPQIGHVELIRQRTDAAGKKRFLRLNMAKGMVREKVLHAMSSEELNHVFETDGYFM